MMRCAASRREKLITALEGTFSWLHSRRRSEVDRPLTASAYHRAFAVVLLTLPGAVGEVLGYDRLLKSKIAKRQTRSPFRQGRMLYELMPTMPEPRLLPLAQKFANMLAELPVFTGTFGAVRNWGNPGLSAPTQAATLVVEPKRAIRVETSTAGTGALNR